MGIHDRKYMSDDSYGRPSLGGGPKTFTTKYVIVCAIAVLANALTEYALTKNLCLNPPAVYDSEIWRLFTAFIMFSGTQNEVMNLVILFVLYSLGNQIETQLGTKTYVNLLITMCIGMMIVGVLIPQPFFFGYVSGILSGLFLAFGLFLGGQKMTLMLFFLIPLTLTGHMLIAFTVGLTIVSGLMGAWLYALPMLGGCFASYVFITQYQKGQTIDLLGWFVKKAKPKQKNAGPRKPAPLNSNQAKFTLLEDDEDIDDVDAFIQDKIDPILEKIATSGMSSLTAKEKKLLEEAKKKMGK